MEQPVALITGGSQGFGLALARSLAHDGWRVVIDARRADRLDAARRALTEEGIEDIDVVAIAGDVADPAHRADLAGAVRRLGRLDLLVNNASTLGGSPLPALDAIDPDLLLHIFEVNVVAPIALTQLVLPLLVDAHGTIVNVTSDAGVEAYEGWGGYGSSKAALEHASAILGVEHPEIRVLWVDPGDMRTEMHRDAFPGEDISDRPLPEAVVPKLLAVLRDEPTSGRRRLAEVA